jgi:hypothetical protein
LYLQLTLKIIRIVHEQFKLNMDYSGAEANPPHPFKKDAAVTHEAVVNYREWATTKPL